MNNTRFIWRQARQRYYFVENNLVHYSVLFNFGRIRRWDQCAVFILFSLEKLGKPKREFEREQYDAIRENMFLETGRC